MNRRHILSLSVITALGLTLLPGGVLAQQKSLKEQIVGAWILTSVYDQGQDGKKNEPWGPNVAGALQFSPTGRFSLQIMSANRDKSASKNPRTPVGQAVGYFGSYSVDETAKKITYHIERATFPQWDGIDRSATVETVTGSELNLQQSPVQDPSLGTITPHLNFKRAM
jgi:hypothetical protein